MSYLVITLQYNVHKEHREAYLDAMRGVRENALNLGAVDYILMEDDAISNRFTEMHIYDGWVQYDNARMSPPSLEMERVFDKMDEWIDGGSNAMEVQFRKVLLGEWE